MSAPRWNLEVNAAVGQAWAHYGVKVDPALVHGIIERETLHGALPITGTQERNGTSFGPMQVLDSTARAHGITEPATLAVPAIGIRIGTFELARLLKLFPGDTARAIAAYNAGSSNAQRNPLTGRFPNQAYVDAVLTFWKRYAGTGGAVVVVAAALVAALLWWQSRRGRKGGRNAAA